MNEEVRQIAERFTNELVGNSSKDVASLRENIVHLSSRIQQLECQIAPPNQNLKLNIQNFAYDPSLEKFNLADAVSEELNEFLQQEKACTFEPGNKPCDHCSMCGSRGF